MTRKHFEMIAAALKTAYGKAESDAERRGVYASALELSWELYGTNPRFNRDRFMTACGVV